MIMKLAIVYLILIISCSCCSSKFMESENLTLSKKQYLGKELRIDGYYYSEYIGFESNDIYLSTYFFFENGVVLYGGATEKTEINKLEEQFKTISWVNATKRYKDGWGLFNIDGNKIMFERWQPRSPGQPVVYVYEGEILNDSTFRINVFYRLDGSIRREVDDIYHFKQFSPKPDSTNVFIP